MPPLALVALLACPSTDPAEPPTPPVEPTLPAAPSVPRGAAWLALDGGGLVRWDARGVGRVGELKEVDDVALAGDVLWAVGDGAVWHSEGDGLTQVVALPPPGSAQGIAVAPDGTVWVAGFLDLWVVNGGALRDVERPSGREPLVDVAVGPDGTVWLATQKEVFQRNAAGAWQPEGIASLAPALEFIGDLAVDAQGEVYAAYLGGEIGLLHRSGGAWQVAPGGAGYSGKGESVVAAADGRIAVQVGQGARVLGDGGFSVDKDRGYTTRDVQTIGLDGRDRVWLGTGEGLVVVGREGPAAQYAPGAVPAIDGELTHVRVIAGGPDLPNPTATRGAVRGTLIAASGEPVADASIGLCSSAALQYL